MDDTNRLSLFKLVIKEFGSESKQLLKEVLNFLEHVPFDQWNATVPLIKKLIGPLKQEGILPLLNKKHPLLADAVAWKEMIEDPKLSRAIIEKIAYSKPQHVELVTKCAKTLNRSKLSSAFMHKVFFHMIEDKKLLDDTQLDLKTLHTRLRQSFIVDTALALCEKPKAPTKTLYTPFR